MKCFRKERKPVILLFEGLAAVVTVTVTQALHRGPLLELFWTDRRLLFQWPQKKAISAGAPSCSSAPVCFIVHLVWIHPLIPLLEFRKHQHGTERSDCLLWDIKANRPVHPRRSCGQKEEQREENAFEVPSLPLCTAFHSNSCWYLLFLWC